MTAPSNPGTGPLALTMGEPAGVGGEIALMAWLRRSEGVPPFLLIDNPERLRRLALDAGLAARVEAISSPAQALDIFPNALPVLKLSLPAAATPGRPDPATAGTVIESIDRAVSLVRDGSVAAMVTNPIHKSTLYDAGFSHPGHTEYLAHCAGLENPAVMMLACSSLRVVPVTVHLSLTDAIADLTAENIIYCSRRTDQALRTDFTIATPRLAVAGLNPHAGESGTMGAEETAVIAPAVTALRAEGIDATGPLPADTLFHEDTRRNFDAVICMYHDQALIPLKTIDFHGSVNITLGLPFVRTSPDHGTAFDLAGSGRAVPDSLIAALRMAQTVAHNRADASRGREVA